MEVDVGQLAMLTSLTNEQDGAAPFDLDDGAVAEFHRPTDPRVELEERRSSPGHMVCCPCVKDPIAGARVARPSCRSERTLAPPPELAPQLVPSLLRPSGALSWVQHRRRIWNRNWGHAVTMKRAGAIFAYSPYS